MSIICHIIRLGFLVLFFWISVPAQTTAFNFQGRLNDGSVPANGRYDLQFKLFDMIAGGTQIGPTLDRPNAMLVNGVFSTPLDFGTSAFSGSERFLEILVRRNGSPNGYVILGARQQLLSVPFAVRASNAANSDNAVNAQNSVNATNATNAATAAIAQNSLSLAGQPASSYARLNFANQGDLAASNVATNGNLAVGGNTTQLPDSFGLPKAMIFVDNAGHNLRCYNGLTGSSSGGCGFVVTQPLGDHVGVYKISFGFPVSNRFVSLAVDNISPLLNFGINFNFDGSDLLVFTFVTDTRNDSSARNFMAIVY
jgi:hypothetical protein